MRIFKVAAFRMVLLILALSSTVSRGERRGRNRGGFYYPNSQYANAASSGFKDLGGNLSSKDGQLYYRDVNGGRQQLYVTSQGKIIFPDGRFYPQVHNEAMAYYQGVAKGPQWEGLREKIEHLPGGGRGLLENIVPNKKIAAPTPRTPESPPRETAERKPGPRHDHDSAPEKTETPTRPEAGDPENPEFAELKIKFDTIAKMPQPQSQGLGDLISSGVMTCKAQSSSGADYNTRFAINESTREVSSTDRSVPGAPKEIVSQQTDLFIDYKSPHEPEPWVHQKFIEAEETWKMRKLEPFGQFLYGNEPDTGTSIQLKYLGDLPMLFMSQGFPKREQWVCIAKSSPLPKVKKESEKMPDLAKELFRRLGVASEPSPVDLKKLGEYLQSSHMRAGISRNQPLLNALAILLSDKRCHFWDFDLQSTDGKALLVIRSGEGVKTPLNLTNRPSETSENEWLNGKNGLYKQLTDQGICTEAATGLALDAKGEVAQLARQFFRLDWDRKGADPEGETVKKRFVAYNKAALTEAIRKYREENNIPREIDLHAGPRPGDFDFTRADKALRITDGWGVTLVGAHEGGVDFRYSNPARPVTAEQKKTQKAVLDYLSSPPVKAARENRNAWKDLEKTTDFETFRKNVKLLWGREDDISIDENLGLRSGLETKVRSSEVEEYLGIGPNHETVAVGFLPPFDPPIKERELAATGIDTFYVFRPMEVDGTHSESLVNLAKRPKSLNPGILNSIKTYLSAESVEIWDPNAAGTISIVGVDRKPLGLLTKEGKLYKLDRTYDQNRQIKQ